MSNQDIKEDIETINQVLNRILTIQEITNEKLKLLINTVVKEPKVNPLKILLEQILEELKKQNKFLNQLSKKNE